MGLLFINTHPSITTQILSFIHIPKSECADNMCLSMQVLNTNPMKDNLPLVSCTRVWQTTASKGLWLLHGHHLSDFARKLDSPTVLCPAREAGAFKRRVTGAARPAPWPPYTCLITGEACAAEAVALACSHWKKPQPDVLGLAELGVPLMQEKKHRPVLGPGVWTVRRLALRPHLQSGGVAFMALAEVLGGSCGVRNKAAS